MGLYAALLRMMGMSTNIDQYTPEEEEEYGVIHYG